MCTCLLRRTCSDEGDSLRKSVLVPPCEWVPRMERRLSSIGLSADVFPTEPSPWLQFWPFCWAEWSSVRRVRKQRTKSSGHFALVCLCVCMVHTCPFQQNESRLTWVCWDPTEPTDPGSLWNVLCVLNCSLTGGNSNALFPCLGLLLFFVWSHDFSIIVV